MTYSSTQDIRRRDYAAATWIVGGPREGMKDGSFALGWFLAHIVQRTAVGSSNKEVFMRKTLISASLVLSTVLFAAGTVLAQPWGGHGPGMMGWGHGWGWLGLLLMIIVWALVILGIIALIRWLWTAGPRHAGGQPPAALDILKARYAKGEINKEEFEQKKKDLGS
jgi:putative membrane protein